MVLDQHHSFKFLPRNFNSQQKRVSTYVVAVLLAAFVLVISNSVLPDVEPQTGPLFKPLIPIAVPITPLPPRFQAVNVQQSSSSESTNYSGLTPSRRTGNAVLPASLTSTSTATVVNTIDSTPNATFVIICGTQLSDAVAEMQPLLKSMLLLASAPIRIVFLTDASGAKRLRRLFATDLAWFRRPLRVDIIHIRESDIDKFVLKLRVDPDSDIRAGRWALAKLMVPWLVPGVEKVVIVDTDMIFVKDPMQLWEEHNVGGTDWVYRMPLNRRHSVDAICSCVVLVRCDLARRMLMYPTMFKAALASAGEKERRWYDERKGLWRLVHADQGLLWVTMHKYPKAFSELPLMWNREKCHNYYWVFKPESRGDVGIFHRNCAGYDSRKATDDASEMFDFFLRYQWHWLRAKRSNGFLIEVHNWNNLLPTTAG